MLLKLLLLLLCEGGHVAFPLSARAAAAKMLVLLRLLLPLPVHVLLRARSAGSLVPHCAESALVAAEIGIVVTVPHPLGGHPQHFSLLDGGEGFRAFRSTSFDSPFHDFPPDSQL